MRDVPVAIRKKSLDAPASAIYTPRPFLNMKRLRPYLLGIAAAIIPGFAEGQSSQYQSSEEFARYAMKLREAAITAVEPRISVPTAARTVSAGGAYNWRHDIVTTVFWVGESATARNPVHNRSSSWDVNWAINFGGYDNPDPAARVRGPSDYRAAAFIPRLNPFYIALPYNDVTRGTTKPEARQVIPWFKTAFVREGQSVCRDRWVAVRNRRNGRIAYAQWSDCGPFRTDHWQYVFGKERPRPNLNKGAGLDVSPSVRDYLGLTGVDVTDWRFVEAREVPPGPWRKYGENNPFVQQSRRSANPVVIHAPDKKRGQQSSGNAPKVSVR
jgi:hypothetical protein